MTRVVQIELTLNVEIEAHFHTGDDTSDAHWVVDEIVSMSVQGPSMKDNYDLATSSILAIYLLDERGEELADLFAQQEP
jgi:hypothetical protein